MDFNSFDDQEFSAAAGPDITASAAADVSDSVMDFDTLVTEAPKDGTIEEEEADEKLGAVEEQDAPVEGETEPEAEADESEAQLPSANVSMRGRSSSKANKKVSASFCCAFKVMYYSTTTFFLNYSVHTPVLIIMHTFSFAEKVQGQKVNKL